MYCGWILLSARGCAPTLPLLTSPNEKIYYIFYIYIYIILYFIIISIIILQCTPSQRKKKKNTQSIGFFFSGANIYIYIYLKRKVNSRLSNSELLMDVVRLDQRLRFALLKQSSCSFGFSLGHLLFPFSKLSSFNTHPPLLFFPSLPSPILC